MITVLVNATIFDGARNSSLENGTVVIEGDRIRELLPVRRIRDSRVIDCGGRYLHARSDRRQAHACSPTFNLPVADHLPSSLLAAYAIKCGCAARCIQLHQRARCRWRRHRARFGNRSWRDEGRVSFSQVGALANGWPFRQSARRSCSAVWLLGLRRGPAVWWSMAPTLYGGWFAKNFTQKARNANQADVVRRRDIADRPDVDAPVTDDEISGCGPGSGYASHLCDGACPYRRCGTPLCHALGIRTVEAWH